jgi:hypothetical protein
LLSLSSSARAFFVIAHLADLLFADRRWRDGFAAGMVPSRVVPMWNKLDRPEAAGRRSRADAVDPMAMPWFHTSSMRA